MRILQFGTGNFLRGFFAPVISEAGSINVVQSVAGSQGAKLINSMDDGYRVWTRGIDRGKVIDSFEKVHSLNRAFDATTGWDEIMEVATSSELELIVSNTTEKGLVLVPDDSVPPGQGKSPESFPARLCALLHERFRRGLPGVTILPMELVDRNAHVLKGLVIQQSRLWFGPAGIEFGNWLVDSCRWLENLVDRIVVSSSGATPWNEYDPLAVTTEPYRLLAIRDDGFDRSILPAHPMISWVDDLHPLFERKVRILNGLHTAMVCRCLPAGFETVRQVIEAPREREWLEKLIDEEIVPVLETRIPNVRDFVINVWDRLKNPFFDHRLESIALNHDAKVALRLMPTYQEYRALYGREPAYLGELCRDHFDSV